MKARRFFLYIIGLWRCAVYFIKEQPKAVGILTLYHLVLALALCRWLNSLALVMDGVALGFITYWSRFLLLLLPLHLASFGRIFFIEFGDFIPFSPFSLPSRSLSCIRYSSMLSLPHLYSIFSVAHSAFDPILRGISIKRQFNKVEFHFFFCRCCHPILCFVKTKRKEKRSRRQGRPFFFSRDKRIRRGYWSRGVGEEGFRVSAGHRFESRVCSHNGVDFIRTRSLFTHNGRNSRNLLPLKD